VKSARKVLESWERQQTNRTQGYSSKLLRLFGHVVTDSERAVVTSRPQTIINIKMRYLAVHLSCMTSSCTMFLVG
jgi:hypothetical protein